MNDKYTFMPVQEFAKILFENQGHLYSYTLDSPEDGKTDGFMPEGWYGAVVLNLFDAETPVLLVGYFGGRQWSNHAYSKETIAITLNDFHEFYEAFSPGMVCVEKQSQYVAALR